MVSQRLQPTRQAFYRSHLLALLSLVDVTTPVILGLLAAQLMVPAGSIMLTYSNWLLSTWVAWGAIRGRRAGLGSYRYYESIMIPLAALIISLVVLALIDASSAIKFLVVVTLGWGLIMLVSRFLMRRFAPAMVVGVLPGMESVLPQGPDVRYVLLTTPQQVALQELDELLIDPHQALSGEWAELLMHAYASGVPTCTVASLQEELSGRVSVEYLHGARLGEVPFLSSYVLVKAVLDRLVTLLALPVLLPLAGLVALTVLIDSGRPLLFWQERVGRNGRVFRMVKFRSMRIDSERGGAAFAVQGDARVTRVGHFLRKFRLDELPQFWNVLRGDMSIIGPRPEQGTFVERFNQEIRLYPLRHWVRPGITGWAQVVQGYAADTGTTIDKLRYDVFYIKHLSFWLDVRIVFKTLQTILTGFGAR
ncbi:exopolysaccharide biosynthesis polyprenyl glycosylphosphotransferase [Deinococcus koreensis]|uniref:Exopolysaccharide biosynthesis polyprenyl glycosylphosphotransferase n=1 Tax=Deinococcus koreensis TaxID=2054903 RepID=A0A2K3UZB4_9DEIO|nr:exopolysaccharide biosynthesis polyprenyl glycosylphosphotransferase [Deinococcus koreensis]PNY81871.1 exopolysaccharide biosynthesis polyprenyl glycosylphosphotransferase [Deinococcus koreensis]